MRILIADDHPLYLTAVRDQIQRLYPGAVTEMATGLAETLTILRQPESRDLILLDYSMPGMNGNTGVRSVVSAASGVPVVVMSGVAAAAEVSLCIGIGAKAFLPKTLDSKIFASALNVVLAGGSYLPAEMFGAPSPPAPESLASRSSGDGFTERERGIMDMVAEGKSNKEIARLLNLREVTIKVQLTHIYKKLGAKNRAQAAMLMTQGRLTC